MESLKPAIVPVEAKQTRRGDRIKGWVSKAVKGEEHGVCVTQGKAFFELSEVNVVTTGSQADAKQTFWAHKETLVLLLIRLFC